MVVRLFVDASYGVHKDGKSHTGSRVARRSRSSALYVLKTVHHGQEQYGRRANGDIELTEPGATLKAVPHRARMQDGTSDHVPR
jgi:hypothetical protein